jgi:hypothetical protein
VSRARRESDDSSGAWVSRKSGALLRVNPWTTWGACLRSHGHGGIAELRDPISELLEPCLPILRSHASSDISLVRAGETVFCCVLWAEELEQVYRHASCPGKRQVETLCQLDNLNHYPRFHGILRFLHDGGESNQFMDHHIRWISDCPSLAVKPDRQVRDLFHQFLLFRELFWIAPFRFQR